jgi:GNAT superfamily N-acetyltransferase
MKVQHACYPEELWESQEVFQAIIADRLSYVYCVEEDDERLVIGYLLVHLGKVSEELNTMPDSMNCDSMDDKAIRDLAVLPEWRKQGVAMEMLNEFFYNFGSSDITLVVLDSAYEFWNKRFEMNEVKKVKHGTLYKIVKKL